MHKSVKSLCEGKFASLEHYFDGAITVSDLNDLTVEDVVECMDTKHKLLAKIFWSTIIVNILDNPDPFEYGDETNEDEILTQDVSEDVIRFHDRIVSSAIHECPLPDHLHRIETLSAHLKQRPNLEKCKVLDLSRNNLILRDGKYIVECARILPNCTFVDLKINRLSDCSGDPMDWLIDLAKLEHVMYIRITQNALATSECQDFWKFVQNSTNEDQKNILLDKMIWVDENWISRTDGGWRLVIDSRFISVVLSVHEKFYRQWGRW